MSVEVLIVENFTGTLDPDTHNFEVADQSAFLRVLADDLPASQQISLWRRDYAGTGWQPATNGSKQQVLHSGNNESAPLGAGEYGLKGAVTGVTLFTREND
jgi:hypothetical protein